MRDCGGKGKFASNSGVFSGKGKGSCLDLNASVDGSRDGEFLVENSSKKKAIKGIVEKLSSNSNDVPWRFEYSGSLIENSPRLE